MQAEKMNTSASDSEPDSSDSDSESIGTDISEEILNTNIILDISYHLADEKALSLKKEYIHHVCGSISSDQVAIASGFSMSLFDITGLKIASTFMGHGNLITNLKFNPSDPQQLISSSSDGTIKFWDTRKAGESVLTFQDDTAGSGKLKPFLSFDVSKSGHFFCAGTELFEGDAFLVFGDARNVKVLGGYWESHSDDITQVLYHPLISDTVISGSSDGLINFYDLKNETEDEALINSLNTESHVDKLGWYTVGGIHKGISCILDSMDVQLWVQDGTSPSSTYSRRSVSENTGWKADNSYMVSIHQTTEEELLFLAGESNKNSERLALLQMKNEGLLVESELPGNKQRVRCSWYNIKDKSLITAGENGILSLWRPGAESVANKAPKVLPKQPSSRSKPY